MGLYRQLVRRLGPTRLFGWLGPRLIHPLDRRLHRLSGGAVPSAGPRGIPVLTLTTVGRRSGQERSVPLVYLEDDGRLVVVASNWGRRRHPAWSANLLAHPEATVQLGRHRRAVQARLATAEEKAALWPRLLELWPGWQVYQHRSGRDLRVFLLEPTP